jgi:hypothetical protein
VLKGIQLAILEMNLTDYSFYILLNLSVFQRFSVITPTRLVSFITALYILIRMLALYLGIAAQVGDICYADTLSHDKKSPVNKSINSFEKEVLLEGINYKLPLEKRKQASMVNLYFRLQLLVVPALIVTG